MTTKCTSEKIGLVLKGENTLPVVLHADDDPAILLCLIVERLGEGPDPRVRQTFGGTVGILSLRIIMEHQHRKPRAVAGLGVFQHLAITGRVAERCVWPAADH